ncbi:MAG: K+ channel, inward rectifier, partial [Flavobacteriales bacterium]
TVGYGAIAPIGSTANIISAAVALAGSMYFALVTGLIYGRFSKPKAKLIFSENLLIAPYKDGEALMFRLANRRKNVLMQMKAEVLLVMKDGKGKTAKRTFFNLDLEIDRIQFMPLSWTVVHPIDENSPILNCNLEEMKKRGAEVLILVSGFDDTFNQDVHSRYSYTANEFVEKAKFQPAFDVSGNGAVQMDINEIHKFHKV